MGRRGGGWVAAQAVVLVVFAGAAPWTAGTESGALRLAAILLAVAGFALAAWAATKLGRALTPFPRPVENARLCREGPYRAMRHPIYAAVLLICAAWAAWWASLPAAMLLPLVFAFFALKARAEERWLVSAWPEYREYSRRVKRIIPFVY